MFIKKFAVHVLDKSNDEPILSDKECKMNVDLDDYLSKNIKKLKKNDDLRSAKFEDNSAINEMTKEIFRDNKKFLDISKEMASIMFEHMKDNIDIVSHDLAIVLYSNNLKQGIAIIKLDYKDMLSRSITFDEAEEKFEIDMVKNSTTIAKSMTTTTYAFIEEAPLNTSNEVYILDNELLKSTFREAFLKVKLIKDDVYKTRKFISCTNTYINSMRNISEAEIFRRKRNEYMLTKKVLDIKQFMDVIIKDKEMRDDFKKFCETAGILENFNIARKRVEKMTRVRNIKTDIGIKIDAKSEVLEDEENFEIVRRVNGKYDLVIKGVSHIE